MAKILFCEDDLTIQKLFGAAMRNTGHLVFVASDGKEGLEFAIREVPDVIVTDLGMPGLNGYELLESVKVALPSVPVVLLTASAQRTELDNAKTRGFVSVLVKPFSPAALRAEILRLLDAPS